MKKLVVLLFFWIGFIVASFGQFSPGYFALKDVSIVDVEAKKVLQHYTIIIRGNIIESLGQANNMIIPDSAVIFNYPGKFVIPGLIDSHVHLATEPTRDDNRARAEKDLKDMLLTGITSVRDMAGDARALASLSRDAKLDNIIAPDIYYAALMAGPSFFNDPRTHQSTQGGVAGNMPFMKAVTDTTDLELAIAEAKGTGATAIKLYADLDGELAKKITKEAHRQHMPVWSHANLTIASPLEVINAGVNSISHSPMITGWPAKKIPEEWLRTGLDDNFWDNAFKTLPVHDLIEAMLANKTILDATLVTFKAASTDESISQKARLMYLANYEIGRRFTLLALKNGIPVSAGTDLDEKKFVQREMRLLVKEGGFAPMDALVSATINGARAIGIEKMAGSIAEGKVADLVVLSSDPTANIDNIDKVDLVIKNGKLFNGSH